jgi:formylglycine-generating enzyme required for sulfatase activity
MAGLAGFPNNPEPSYFKGDDRRPAEYLSWDDAQRFIWLMSFFGRRHYHLPSEAQWEYAVRAGTTSSRYWGDNIDDGCAYENIADQSFKRAYPSDPRSVANLVANCDDHYAATAPVASYKPNPWGLYDMLGNVANWVQDCYANNYRKTPADGSPNTASNCTSRVVRGGSWRYDPRFVRAAYRDSSAPGGRYSYVGLRLARTVAP